MLRNLLVGLTVLILVIVAGAYLTPRHVQVERSLVINASASEIFPYLNDYRQFNQWSPWAERDPDAVYTFEGPDAGVGARMSWSGNKDVGTGTQEILLSDAPNRLEVHLDFGGQGEADSYFDLQPVDGGTDVTWGFETDMGLNPVGRYMGLMMDSWIGADYEEGLTKLQGLVEDDASN